MPRSLLYCLALALAACADRPIGPTVDGGATVADAPPSAAPFAYAAYDTESNSDGSLACGAILGLADVPLATCRDGHLSEELSGRSLRLRLTSNSDAGGYQLAAGWSCKDRLSGIHFDGLYTDEAGSAYQVTDGSLQIDTIGSGINIISGGYHLVVQDAAGQSVLLEGSFSAPPCGI